VWWLGELEALEAFAWLNESYAKKSHRVCRGLEVGVGDVSLDEVNVTVGVQTALSRLRLVMTTLRLVIHTWFDLLDSLSKESAGSASCGLWRVNSRPRRSFLHESLLLDLSIAGENSEWRQYAT
jgi:hypothetical protein